MYVPFLKGVGNMGIENQYIAKLIRAAMHNETKNVESYAIMIARKMRKDDPQTSSEIMKIISCVDTGSDVFRSINMSPLPVDQETRYQIAMIEEPVTSDDPVLPEAVLSHIQDFVRERELVETFLANDITPPNSLLLYGMPGVGKTMIAKWLSFKLNLPLVTIDLANSISSYLGRSGQNIKSLFQYAKAHNAILFLDEIDAIAKKRDDDSDLGELKRLVNVLLKEMESLPVTCVVIGATNHPTLLDKAIWRRFDRAIEIPLPSIEERNKLICRTLGSRSNELSNGILSLLAHATADCSAADICKMCEHIKRKTILYPNDSIETSAIKELISLQNASSSAKEKKAICLELRRAGGKQMTIKRIAEITGFSTSAVDRYIKEDSDE